jgi:hypothetical protein
MKKNIFPYCSIGLPNKLALTLLAGSLTLTGTLGAQNIDLANLEAGGTADGFTIHGARAFDYSGLSVSGAGDVNGDGFADILIGAARADGPNDSRSSAGNSYVLFGKASGFSNLDLAIFNSAATDDGFAIFGASDADYSGWSVSGAGDLNSDGFSDIIIGAPGGDGPGGLSDAVGESYVLFGKASGFSNIDLTTLVAAATANGFAIFGADINDQSGSSVSGAGDVNGDGFADIIIGSRNSDGPGDSRNYASESYVLFGKATGFSYIDLASYDKAATVNGFAIFGAAVEDFSGFSVSGAGDVNGDGFADILIGARDADGPADTRYNTGDSYVLFGKASGFSNIDLATLNSGATANGFAIFGVDDYDSTGFSVSGAGDVNGDGFGDILISARSADGPNDSRSFAGDSYVLFGKASGFSNIDLSTLKEGATADGFTIRGAGAYDESGCSVSGAGDVNGDGFADILIGARRAKGPNDSLYSAGESYVLFGKASGFSNIDLATLAAGTTVDGFAIFGASAYDFSGSSVSGVGDVNGDGFADILIGSPSANGPNESRISAGNSYLLFGKGTATSASYNSIARIGDAPRQAIGISGDGSNDSTPDGRAFIDFEDGSNVSTQTVTLTRNNTAVQNLPDTANVMWDLSTNRTDWTSAEVTFLYTNAEIEGLTETNLILYQAPSPEGPWRPVTGYTLLPQRNQIKGTVSSFGFFALSTDFDATDGWVVR